MEGYAAARKAGRFAGCEIAAGGLRSSPTAGRPTGASESGTSNICNLCRFWTSFTLLTYVYAAAMAGRTKAEGGPVYLHWITWVWQGDVCRVIAELAARGEELGPPPADAGETDPRQIIAGTLTYLVNQQSRMNYSVYRQQGLPVTSNHIESTVKQINQRVKGSENFWTAERGEALLQLRDDQLSDTQPLSQHWFRRYRSAHLCKGRLNTIAKCALAFDRTWRKRYKGWPTARRPEMELELE